MPYTCLMVDDVGGSIPNTLKIALQAKYSAVAVPVVQQDYFIEFEHEPAKSHSIAFARSDLILPADEWSHKIVAILPDSLKCDSEHKSIREQSEQELLQYLSWTAHLQNAGYMMLSISTGKRMNNLARLVSRNVKGLIIAKVPIHDPSFNANDRINKDELGDYGLTTTGEDTWQWWNNFRSVADFHPRIKVGLELTAEPPTQDTIRRWLGEPVEALIIPSHIFIRNKSNYPVLPKVWQQVLRQFLPLNINFFVSIRSMEEGIEHYFDYLNNFREKFKEADIMQGLDDVLEIPLQPLYDNLDCYTYEVFEKDPIKYRFYQDAIAQALIDRVPDAEIETKTTIVMVLGAGRGPLVRSALNASKKTNRRIRVYIIEKNPNALNTLSALLGDLWDHGDIHLFSKDMRYFTPPEKADILVSELLGSFGDNELSPECLDCAQVLLKDDGISIPSKSTSYINPVMSPKIYNAVRAIDRSTGPRDPINTYLTNSEYAYVVYMRNIYNIDFPQALFEFVHPNRETPINNERYKSLTFKVGSDCVLTGIGGYFDTVLYKDIKLSINPLTHSAGMSSWFPMYFPISTPQQLKAGEEVTIDFWRCVGPHKVWYEWAISSPFVSHIHNQNARACSIMK